MLPARKNIFDQLQQQILALQACRLPAAGAVPDAWLGPVAGAFPNQCFPTGAVHEFLSMEPEQAAATSGFIAGLLGILMKGGKVCVWISKERTLFPPALKTFGVVPEQIIFVDLAQEKDLLWVMEEALKCEGLAAVIGEVSGISFTASRRLQLAVEQSRVTGFLIRQQTRNPAVIACVARWKIHSLPSFLEDNMPGVGFPRWQVSLLKVRNGKPGSWPIEWREGCFQPLYTSIPLMLPDQKRKTG